MGQITAYGGMLGGRGSVPGQDVPGGRQASSGPDLSIVADGLLPVATALSHLFPDASSSAMSMQHDDTQDALDTIAGQLYGFNQPWAQDALDVADGHVHDAGMQAARLGATNTLGFDSGGGVIDFTKPFNQQPFITGLNFSIANGRLQWAQEPTLHTTTYQWVNNAGPPVEPYGAFVSRWLQEHNTNTYAGPTEQQWEDDWSALTYPVTYQHLDSFPNLFPGDCQQALFEAAAAGPASLMVQATANHMWMTRYLQNQAANTNSGVVVPADLIPRLDALAARYADIQMRLDDVHTNVGRVEIEVIAGFTALGFGALYAASWFAAILVSIFGELTAALVADVAQAIADIGSRAFQIAAEGVTVESEALALIAQVHSSSDAIQQKIKDELVVMIATGAKVKIGEFLSGVLVNVNGEYKNLMAEAYVLDNEGHKVLLSEALRGLVYMEPETGARKHMLLTRMGLPQSELGV